MQTTSLLKKALAVGIIFLFLGVGIIPSPAQIIKKPFLSDLKGTTNHDTLATRGDINWTFNGTMGKNGIYISPVIVTCTYNHSSIAIVYYSYFGDWTLYTEPFTISIQGRIELRFILVDHHGNISPIGFINIDIDYTPPSVSISVRRDGFFIWKKYVVAATVSDFHGIWYVEFYLNGKLRFNATNAPWQWILYPVPRWQHLLFKVVAYDYAGNSNEGQVLKSNIYTKGFHP